MFKRRACDRAFGYLIEAPYQIPERSIAYTPFKIIPKINSGHFNNTIKYPNCTYVALRLSGDIIFM